MTLRNRSPDGLRIGHEGSEGASMLMLAALDVDWEEA
jgi:hypothetical protein